MEMLQGPHEPLGRDKSCLDFTPWLLQGGRGLDVGSEEMESCSVKGMVAEA